MLLIESLSAKRRALFIGCGAVAFAAGLVITMPAKAALTLTGAPEVWSDVAGSAWRGEVAFADRLRAGWRADWLGSLLSASLAADLALTAPATDVRGQARLRPGSVVIERLQGAAGWPLAAALVPAMPFACDVDMRVDLRRAAFGGSRPGIEGEVVSGAGPCASTGGPAMAPPALPALIATATRNDAGSTIVITRRDNRADEFARIVVPPSGRSRVSLSPSTSALLAGAPPPL